jgi:hypothetical protein
MRFSEIVDRLTLAIAARHFLIFLCSSQLDHFSGEKHRFMSHVHIKFLSNFLRPAKG